jgi:hypothetical protein
MDADLLHRCGVAPGDAQDVRELVSLLRFGGPRAVPVELGSESAVDSESTIASPLGPRGLPGEAGEQGLCAARMAPLPAQFKQVHLRTPWAVSEIPPQLVTARPHAAGRACSLQFAEALDAEAQEELLSAGVFVLGQAGIRIHARR